MIRHPTSTQTSQTSHPTPPQHSAYYSTQYANQTTTQIPTKGIRVPRPSSTSSIAQISAPSVSTKTSVILRNKNNVCNQQQTHQTIVDKIKHYNRCERSGQTLQLIANGEQSIPQIVNKSESNISKRTSGSSGFSSAKSDSSASLQGLETSVGSTVWVNSNGKPSVTQTVSKTRSPNQSANISCISLNTNTNTNSNINNNFSNNLLKNEDICNNCENLKSNPNSNRSSTYSGKLGSIPVKRIQPPRSRPTSIIVDNNSIPSAMASSSHSSSNTSLTNIVKPTAAVKGTSKVSAQEQHRISSRKMENMSLSADQTSLSNDCSKPKNKSENGISQPEVPIPNYKPEPSIAMVSPIMAREQLKFKTKEEEKTSKEQKSFNLKVSSNGLKKSEEKHNKKDKKGEQHNKATQQPSSESNNMQDSTSSHGEGEESASNSDVDSSLVNIKPMAPLVRTSQFAFLRSNGNQYCNGTSNSRFPNNYSSIENGYLSDCHLVINKTRANYRDRCSVAGSTAGYVSESDVCSPHFKRSQIMSSKADFMSAQTQRHFTDDKNVNEIRKLRRELNLANDKISTLTSQLTTNVSQTQSEPLLYIPYIYIDLFINSLLRNFLN